jgi:vacuolar iron transporter family protein
MFPSYNHKHVIHRIAWIRAATLGANDGVISIASLLLGMVSAGMTFDLVYMSSVAGLVAGAVSMAAGEWVSVMSQADAEASEVRLEAQHIESNPQQELLELQMIYEQRGLRADLAKEVAIALTQVDALESHTRDELGITSQTAAKPLQAAMASALTFLLGGSVPLGLLCLSSWLSLSFHEMSFVLVFGSLWTLFLTGALISKASNSPVWRGAFRVVMWGAASMVLTSLVGILLS